MRVGQRLLVLKNGPIGISRLRKGDVVTIAYKENVHVKFKETGNTLWLMIDTFGDFEILPDKSDNFDNLYLKLCGE